MALLSHDMAGLILPYDHFGSRLSDSGVTTNIDLEKLNFRQAGQMLAERWNQSVIDGFPCFAEYIHPPTTNEVERKFIDVKFIMDQILREICHEEEEGHEFRISARDEYYQEYARQTRQQTFDAQPKYDIDEYWCAKHVLQTQYTLQFIRCDSEECCGKWISNYSKIFPYRFLPAPVPFERTDYGIRMTDKDCQKGQFYDSLFQRIQFHRIVIQHTQNELLPFDYCCSSVKKELKKRTCQICFQYIPSAYRMRNHYKIHAQHYEHLDENQILSTSTSDETTQDDHHHDEFKSKTTISSINNTDLLDYLENDLE